jgi:flavin reductase (DIM6/NTAB) family NADH-FMN oxidoreductase RutF
MESFDTGAFRQALGLFPTGVVAVTAGKDQHVGITANSFTSVSLDPPIVLWCLAKKSDRFQAFTRAEAFTISILGTNHEAVSARLAKQGSHNLDGIELLPTKLGPPALGEALAFFECERQAVHDAGDHAIILGKVVHLSRHDTGPPLVFFQGRYGALTRGESATQNPDANRSR